MLLANSACVHIKVVQPLQVFSGFFLDLWNETRIGVRYRPPL